LLQAIRVKLPFLIGLTADERKALPKLGDKSQPFIERAPDRLGWGQARSSSA
jgi:hypothetical protein